MTKVSILMEIPLMMISGHLSLHLSLIHIYSHLHKAKFISPKLPDERPETIIPGSISDLPAMEISQINSSLQRILIVEDNDDLRNYLVDMLKTSYNIQACPNGKDALIIIREFNPE